MVPIFKSGEAECEKNWVLIKKIFVSTWQISTFFSKMYYWVIWSSIVHKIATIGESQWKKQQFLQSAATFSETDYNIPSFYFYIPHLHWCRFNKRCLCLYDDNPKLISLWSLARNQFIWVYAFGKLTFHVISYTCS